MEYSTRRRLIYPLTLVPAHSCMNELRRFLLSPESRIKSSRFSLGDKKSWSVSNAFSILMKRWRLSSLSSSCLFLLTVNSTSSSSSLSVFSASRFFIFLSTCPGVSLLASTLLFHFLYPLSHRQLSLSRHKPFSVLLFELVTRLSVGRQFDCAGASCAGSFASPIAVGRIE